jgi:hypothetical protein
MAQVKQFSKLKGSRNSDKPPLWEAPAAVKVPLTPSKGMTKLKTRQVSGGKR